MPIINGQLADADEVALEHLTTGAHSDITPTKITSIVDDTTGDGLKITADSLTTGTITHLYSNASNTSARNLLFIENDHTAAVGATCLHIQQDADADAISITTGATTDRGIEVTADSLTTGNIVYLYSNASTTNSRKLVHIINDHTAATGTVGLSIQQDVPNYCIFLDQNGDGSAIFIDSENLSGVTAGIRVDADSLTTGSAAIFQSDSSTTNTRKLVKIINDNTAATGAQCLNIQQDANCPAVYIDSIGQTTQWNTQLQGGASATTGGVLYVYSNCATTNARQLLSIINDNTTAAGATCLKIDQDANQVSINIDTECTTTNGIYVGADVLTTGSIASFSSASVTTNARNLVSIINDDTAAAGAIPLYIQQDATGKPVIKFAGIGGDSSIDPSATAESDWIQIDVAGTAYYIPIYLAS